MVLYSKGKQTVFFKKLQIHTFTSSQGQEEGLVVI